MNKFEMTALNYYIKRCNIIGENPTIFGFKAYYKQYHTVFNQLKKTA